MSRTVAALYNSRAEAELARGRLASQFKARTARIIAKDTAAAVDTLDISKQDATAYRQGVLNGAHLLVAEVPSGASAKRVVDVLQQAAGEHAQAEAAPRWDEVQQGFQVASEKAEERPAAEPQPQAKSPSRPPKPALPAQFDLAPNPKRDGLAEKPQPIAGYAQHDPVDGDELRVGKPSVARGGARVRSFIRNTPVEEEVALEEERLEVDHRPSGKPISESEVQAGGLFKDRVFEVSEMREEPVVTKVAIVREELIVRRRVEQRTETIRDTVQHTEIGFEEDTPAGAADRAAANRAAATRARTSERT